MVGQSLANIFMLSDVLLRKVQVDSEPMSVWQILIHLVLHTTAAELMRFSSIACLFRLRQSFMPPLLWSVREILEVASLPSFY